MSCCDCGGLKPLVLAPPESVLEVIPAANIVAGWDAAVTTNDGATVSEMFDVSGNGFALVQAVAANQPAFVAAGGPNGNPSVLFDGVDDFLANAALDLPAPGTTPTFYWSIVRQITWTSSDRFWSAEAFDLAVLQGGLVSEVLIANGAAVSAVQMPTGLYKRLRAFFSASVADSLTIGTLSATGASAGNNDAPAGFFVGQGSGGVLFGNIELCELWIFNTLPSALQLTQLDAYAVGRYGTSVVT
jgi:hypothetical protein